MANMRNTTTTRNQMLNAIRDRIDGGAGPGTINIRSGTQPASADLAETGTLLASIPFNDPCAPDASGGVLTMNVSPVLEDSSADNTGTATWARIKDSNGNTIFDCDVGTSGATINLNTVNIVAGGPVRITGFTITQPAG